MKKSEKFGLIAGIIVFGGPQVIGVCMLAGNILHHASFLVGAVVFVAIAYVIYKATK